jgi:hypothetical protein
MADITLTQVDADLARLNQYNLALEGFRRVMEGREVITGPTAVAMRIALEDATVDQDDDKGVTGKDIATGFKKVMITVKNIIQWLLRTIGKLVEKLGLGMQKLGAKGKKVKQALAEMPEEARAAVGKGEAAELPKEVLQPEMLAIDGQFVGNDVEAVNNVIKMGAWINNDFPKMFDKLMGETERLARAHMKDDTSEAFFKGLAGVIKSGASKPPVPFSSENFAPSVMVDGEHTNTMPLMGDQGLVLLNPNGGNVLNENNPVEMLRGWFVIHFGEFNTKQTGVEDIPVADFNTITKLSDMVNGSIDAHIDAAGDVSSLINKRIGSINSLLDEMSKGGGPGAQGEIAMALGVMLQRLTECLTAVQSWYGRTLNQELGYLGLSIEHATKH